MYKPLFVVILFTLLNPVQSLKAQNRWMFGFNLGGNISRVNTVDTFPQNFSRRNRLGYNAGIQACYDLRPFASLSIGVNYVNKGYKIYNDTLNVDPFVVQKLHTLNVPIGVIFRQQFSGSSFIHEKAGLVLNYTMRQDSVTLYNSKNTQRFRITDQVQNKLYPMFYLGFGIGGKSETGDRYEFTVTYNQSFAPDANLNIEYGKNYGTKFPLSYRGGFVQFGFSYYFNISNFQKSDDYFYD